MKRLLMLALALLLIFGCGPSQQGDTALTRDYRTGTQALVLNFLPNAPPSEVFDTDEFVIGIEVRNKGAHTVTDGTIYLSGFDPRVFGGGLSGQGFSNNQIRLDELPGKSFYNPDGGYAVYSITGRITPLQVNTYTPTILATACYTYSTEASADICIDPDPYSTQIKEKACTPSDITLSGGQGGPIEITQIEVDPTKNDVRLTFHIRNSGGGLVFDPGQLAECSPYSQRGITLEAKNTVRVDYVKVGIDRDISSECQPRGELKLVDGSAVLMCKYTYPTQQGAYKTPVTIKLSYGYRSSTSRTVKIIKTPT
ncbi:hypothetical protein DRJ48_00675 [Candidatus Woesearchaeota archaeon]|nr:hypothetical protein [Candidatus Woesearchaeota archaeon]RLE43519.1 MAG: hypothetical protein DRJ48_00675 [Candidatus Woesearchaeota archaeon]